MKNIVNFIEIVFQIDYSVSHKKPQRTSLKVEPYVMDYRMGHTFPYF